MLLFAVAGQGLELGLDLWSYSPAFTDAAKEHLSLAYMLLNRPEFDTILQCHAKYRHQGMSPPFPHAKSHGGGGGGGSGASSDRAGAGAGAGSGTDSTFKRRFFRK